MLTITLEDFDHWPNQVVEGLFLLGDIHGSRRCPEASVTSLLRKLVMYHGQNSSTHKVMVAVLHCIVKLLPTTLNRKKQNVSVSNFITIITLQLLTLSNEMKSK